MTLPRSKWIKPRQRAQRRTEGNQRNAKGGGLQLLVFLLYEKRSEGPQRSWNEDIIGCRETPACASGGHIGRALHPVTPSRYLRGFAPVLSGAENSPGFGTHPAAGATRLPDRTPKGGQPVGASLSGAHSFAVRMSLFSRWAFRDSSEFVLNLGALYHRLSGARRRAS